MAKLDEIAVLDPGDLTIYTPSVVAVAKSLGWEPSTLLIRLVNALPAVTERHVYLAVGASFRIQPETMQTILRHHLGEEVSLTRADFEERKSASQEGSNLYPSRGRECAEFIEHVLGVIAKNSEYADLRLSVEKVCTLVDVYGAEAEEMLGQLVDQLDEIASCLGYRENYFPRVVFGHAVVVLDRWMKVPGAIAPVDLVAFFDERAGDPRLRKGSNTSRVWEED